MLTRANTLLHLKCSIREIFSKTLGRPTLVGKALSFTHELSFPSFFFINPQRSAATQWMAIKCISEVRS